MTKMNLHVFEKRQKSLMSKSKVWVPLCSSSDPDSITYQGMSLFIFFSSTANNGNHPIEDSID